MPTLSWEEASLNEVFERIGISPAPKGLEKGENYVTALGGYANRLHDIRERLVCRHEGHARLVPNFAYARVEDARYNKTFFYCPCEPDDPDHDAMPGRYFNHCWCCRRVIDSRESPHHKVTIGPKGFKHGLYYCIHCGAGPQPDKDTRDCDIGTVCPRCGSEGQMCLEHLDSRTARLRCSSATCGIPCGHLIQVPIHEIRYGRVGVRWLPPEDDLK